MSLKVKLLGSMGTSGLKEDTGAGACDCPGGGGGGPDGSSGGGIDFVDLSRILRSLYTLFSELGIVLEDVQVRPGFASIGLDTVST